MASAGLLGCGAEADQIAGQSPDQGETPIHRTIVEQKADGTTSVREMEISQADRERDFELRAAMQDGSYQLNVVQDGSCIGAAMWLFDGKNRTGNEICFIGSPTFSGGTVPLPSYGWFARIRSYWSGAEKTVFVRTDTTGTCATSVPPFQQSNDADACVKKAAVIYF